MKFIIEDSDSGQGSNLPQRQFNVPLPDFDWEKRQELETAKMRRWELFVALIGKMQGPVTERDVTEQERLSRLAMERFMEAR